MVTQTISIYYGTETGNSRSVAETIAGLAAGKGISASVHDLVNVSAEQLSRDKDPVIIVISTWNRGKPPFFARRFYAELEEGKTRMPVLNYTVIALGDEHYEYFCACGINVDRMLESLGGKRFMPRTVMGSTFRTDLTKWAQAFWRNLP